MQKVCSNCSRLAAFSLVAIVSTINVSNRLQKSSRAVLFCNDCLRKLCDRQHSNVLYERVNETYTAVKTLLRERSTTKDHISE